MLYSIGHSNHTADNFIDLLRQHDITAIADVRSQPHSKRLPQYRYKNLKAVLQTADIDYIFLGKELGARSNNPECYHDNRVQYDCLAKQAIFKAGLARVIQGMQTYQIALMCAEKDPVDCHRALLVSRSLFAQNIPVTHIHYDGHLETMLCLSLVY